MCNEYNSAIGQNVWDTLSFIYGKYNVSAFHSGKKYPGISGGTKMDFPIGKKLFHLIVNPGMAPSPLPDGTPRWLPSW